MLLIETQIDAIAMSLLLMHFALHTYINLLLFFTLKHLFAPWVRNFLVVLSMVL